jgi:hypothetical protein
VAGGPKLHPNFCPPLCPWEIRTGAQVLEGEDHSLEASHTTDQPDTSGPALWALNSILPLLLRNQRPWPSALRLRSETLLCGELYQVLAAPARVTFPQLCACRELSQKLLMVSKLGCCLPVVALGGCESGGACLSGPCVFNGSREIIVRLREYVCVCVCVCVRVCV